MGGGQGKSEEVAFKNLENLKQTKEVGHQIQCR